MAVSAAAPELHRPWSALASHRRWLDDQAAALTRFASQSVRPQGGFWWLDDAGRADPEEPLHTWIACRMTYVFALANLRGEPGAGPIVDHGVLALRTLLRDKRNGGWYGSVGLGGSPVDATKAAYPHAFVVLAAATAAVAGRPDSAQLLDDALEVVSTRFWDDAASRTFESFAVDWSSPEPYRGANSSMHMVEAFLAAGDATGDPAWYDRALRICAHLIHEVAVAHRFRLPEHYTANWQPILDYHFQRPGDPFRPFGVTIGHLLEWARLLLHVEVAVAAPPPWLLADAQRLFDTAVSLGWAVDGADGFVYTVGWDDRPVVRARMHWVIAEAIAAAAVLRERTRDLRYEAWYRTFWDYARRFVIDPDRGSWHHELDPCNQPASAVWRGKPDVYHAYQATLLPQGRLAPTLARAILREVNDDR
jgi:mannose/cellobiose epimerase-like protein (N-acyl-D-glucosamine 2-epimerase family)